MKILLDECVTHDLRPLLAGHEVFTVAYMNWSGTRNGELLRRAVESGFEAIVSTDHGLPDQHNQADIKIPVVVIFSKTGRIADVGIFVSAILELLSTSPRPGFHILK